MSCGFLPNLQMRQTNSAFAAKRTKETVRPKITDRLKPWYRVVTPREDLRYRKPLDVPEFAVHLDQVREHRKGVDSYLFALGVQPYYSSALCTPRRRSDRQQVLAILIGVGLLARAQTRVKSRPAEL